MVYLDSVDDLDEIDKLEEYVHASQCILIFLSKGYFFRNYCMYSDLCELDCNITWLADRTT